MKITKTQLRKIVKEELGQAMGRRSWKEEEKKLKDEEMHISALLDNETRFHNKTTDAEEKARSAGKIDELELRLKKTKDDMRAHNDNDAGKAMTNVANRKDVREDRMAGMAGQRPSDMFGRVVLVRDIKSIPIEKADGRAAVKHERVRYKGIIQKPDVDPESYPDGGLPGYRETGSVLLSPDQPVIVSLQDGTKISQLGSGETLTLADLVTQREMMSLFKEWKAASPKGRKSLEWPLFVSRQQQ